MAHRPDISTEQLISMYESGMGTYEIARRVGVTQPTIYNRLARMAGIKMRARRDYFGPFPAREIVVAMYRDGHSSGDISRRYKVSPAWVLQQLKAANVAMRSPHAYPKTGPKNPKWKGGRYLLSDGYIGVSIGNGRRRQEHRVIMEGIIGRPLNDNEIVHHFNGIRSDNRPENLTITTRKDHEHYTYVKALQKRIRELEEAHSDINLTRGSGMMSRA